MFSNSQYQPMNSSSAQNVQQNQNPPQNSLDPSVTRALNKFQSSIDQLRSNYDAMNTQLTTLKSQRNRSVTNLARQQNQFYRKLPQDSDVVKQKSEIQKQIEQFIKNVTVSQTPEKYNELIHQIQKNVLGQNAILNQMQVIADKIFYNIKPIKQKIGRDYKTVLFKSINQRFGDLYEYVNNDIAKYIIDFIYPWGSYYFDIKKLQAISSSQKGNSQHKIYEIKQYQLRIHIQKRQITVQHENKEISSQTFQLKTLRNIALINLKTYAQQILYRYFLAEKARII